ncbi:Holliday junction branch migration protein RuvA [Candidatus Methylopumilus planktonicus]|uniref:Holliday junction branch migration protein RuvA n=1 Tax=Candidatus Methylopumilus TaxID=1679002 RepID=UPI00112306F2|nr:Holliday junction branch migration protein RuvA [Candidatus Methylopumilus planktonicus]QDD00799.1 Holliday junction branch migration protein RuvA [Candidatus Methylopumilus planktonicus]QDD02129.1 Holliday junction branch migration protein RuvA [Candidatus Methylopumilus planktonicus]QDD07391.1 Holliday junction branch migration protein RuvA [Candidatus Methylopumilus planktonicus]QDD08720.1 Holliday junction branch migration protein RuvA [Candidatus Methylopumilus planktonicus]QDD10042.1 
MIGRISGILLDKTPPLALIDCNGVGYECEVPMSTFYLLPQLGDKVTLLTHFVVREDAQLLFGFGTNQERLMFRQLLKVNGIGAKSALAILSGLSIDELIQAVSLQEAGLLTRVPGIGKKTAERLLLELKDKFTLDSALSIKGSGITSISQDVLNALIALGYNERESLNAVKSLDINLTVNDGIKQALKYLSKG